MPRRPKTPAVPPAEPVTILDPSAPVTFSHTVGGLSVEVPPIVREESAEKWGYVPPSDDVVMPVGGVYPAMPLPSEAVTPPGRILVQVPEDEYAALLEEHARVAAELESVRRALVAKPLPSRPTTCEEYATRILAEDPRTALALYRRVSRGYGLAEWRPLGAGAQLVDLGTGDMLALVAPEGRRFVASYVESGTNLAGPTADTLDACKDAVGNRMRARGVGVL